MKAYDEILEKLLAKLVINDYYLSWWLRFDFDNKYSTAKINRELLKAVRKGLIEMESRHYGIIYRKKNL